MKRQTRAWIAALVAGFLILGTLGVGPAGAQSVMRYWFRAVDEMGLPYGAASVLCSFYDRAADYAPLAFHTTTGQTTVATTSPVPSDSNGVVSIYKPVNTGDPVEAVCYTSSGGVGRLYLTQYVHTMVIPREGLTRVSRFAFHTNGGALTTTDIVIPTGAMVVDVIVQNTTVSSTTIDSGQPHINVGFIGTHQGSKYNGLVSQHGLTGSQMWNRPSFITSTSADSSGTLTCYSASHRGSLLARFVAGCTAGTHAGVYQETPYFVHANGGLQVAYQVSNIAGLTGHVYILWKQFHVGGQSWTGSN